MKKIKIKYPALIFILSIIWLLKELGYIQFQIPIGPLTIFTIAIVIFIIQNKEE